MKQLIIDQIEVTKNGTIQIRMHKLSSDGDMLGNHRTAVEPGGDIDAQIAAVNAHMGSEGFAPIPDADVARVKATAAATWTPENIAPVTAQVVEAIAVQQAAITEAAAKKLEAETLTAQEIEDAKAREVAANEAKALAEAAEAASKAAQEAAVKAAADLEAENARVATAAIALEAENTRLATAQTIADAIPLAPVEDATVDNLQIRLALNATGLRPSVEAAIAASDQSTQDWWLYATRFLRHNEMVVAMGTALGQTDEQLDALWALAATL